VAVLMFNLGARLSSRRSGHFTPGERAPLPVVQEVGPAAGLDGCGEATVSCPLRRLNSETSNP
jgi:hypothetical protein